jgi:hypothetical protein
MPLKPDPSLRALGFTGGPEWNLGQGGWCWFQTPRTSLGPKGILWLGTTIGGLNTDDDGMVQATAFDTTSGKIRLRRNLVNAQEDDHTSPSVLAIGDKVQISWALHKKVDYFDVGDASVNGPFVVHRLHRPGAIQSPGRGMAYSSAHVVNGSRWILYRGEKFSWNLLTSPDGVTWTARGLVVAPGVTGARPYLHAVSDGKRLHILVTDGNPTEFPGTCVYAGTVEGDFTVKRFGGAVAGTVGPKAPKPTSLTRIAAAVPAADELTDTDLWLCDLQYIDNRPTGILSRRDPWPAGSQAVRNYRHQYLWARQRSTGWVVEPLCWAGSELCAGQPDYSGLGAQDPSLATRVVVSTNVHPVTAAPLVSTADGLIHWELFEGNRVGEGQWQWAALTANSVEDNIRPHIAAGGTVKTLSWLRGTYTGWTNWNTRVMVRKAVAPT